jgi:hypothetical protein
LLSEIKLVRYDYIKRHNLTKVMEFFFYRILLPFRAQNKCGHGTLVTAYLLRISMEVISMEKQHVPEKENLHILAFGACQQRLVLYLIP